MSTARRFGLFDLQLDPADPTRHQLDGSSEPMTAREVVVEVRGAGGKARRVTRTFYGTRFGPLVDLGGHHPAFGWGAAHALAIRDVNAGNFRIFRNFFYWNQATSLDDFVAIQRREAAVPWVNTVAIGRGDGRVWYSDIGAVPHAGDDLRAACATPLSAGFAAVDPFTPVLDGSRSACDWRTDRAAVQAGAMPVGALPWLLRTDYVANMNDSHWLGNVHRPLEGYPLLLGGERRPLALRGRLGHRMALALLQGAAPSAEALGQRLMHDVLTPRAHSAELFRDGLLAQACVAPKVRLDAERAGGAARTVDVGAACEVLRRWSGKADADDRGALLWEAFWSRLETDPAGAHYGVAFSHEAPLDTPRELLAGEGKAAQALAAAVADFAARRRPLDAALGRHRFVESGGQRLPVYGGCDSAGYFVMACNEHGGDRMGPDTLANSYLQVVRFGAAGPEAHTLLAHGQHEDALAGGPGSAPVARYARKAWLRFPFREDQIARDPQLRRTVLPGPAAQHAARAR